MKKVTALFICFVCAFLSQAQSQSDFEFVQSLPKPPTGHHPSIIPRTGNPWLVYAPYWFYKQCISSQQASGCSFTPTCSSYAVSAIADNGIITGMLLTFDRLARCHGWHQPGEYDTAESGVSVDFAP